jgi:hypothetical protein
VNKDFEIEIRIGFDRAETTSISQDDFVHGTPAPSFYGLASIALKPRRWSSATAFDP